VKHLYHTTSFGGAHAIQASGEVRPKNYEAFVSFAEEPIIGGDISANDVLLVFDRSKLGPSLDRVEYDEEWYDAHPEQAAYIAGEGWREQLDLTWLYEPPEDIDPDEYDFWEPDEDDVEAAWREAELESFVWKDSEKEWVSREPGEPVRFEPSWLVAVVPVADVEGWE